MSTRRVLGSGRAASPEGRDHLGLWAVYGVVAVAAAAVLLHAGRGLGFFYDEWTWIVHRRSFTADALLQNHNGHLNIVPVLVYQAMFRVFGLASYVPYRVLVVGLHLLTCTLLFAYLRRRVHPTVALGATTVMLFLGYAWQDLEWPFQIQFIGAVAAGLGALLLIGRNDRRGDIGAAICAGLALGCSGVGVPFALGVLVELGGRRSTWRRLWIPLAPLALYGLWYLGYGASQAQRSNVRLVPTYVAQAASGAAGALVGVIADNGRYLVGALAVLVIMRLVLPGLTPRTVTVLVMPIAFWGLTALSRGHIVEPTASRYLYPGAVFIVLVLGELLRGVRIALVATIAVVLVTAFSIHGNVDQLRAGSGGLRDTWDFVNAELRAVQTVRGLPGSLEIDPQRTPGLTIAQYRDAAADLGDPAESFSDLRTQPDRYRGAADLVVLRGSTQTLLQGAPTPVTSGSPPTIDRSQRVTSTTAGTCVAMTPQPGTQGSALVSGADISIVVIASDQGPITLRVRSLSSQFGDPGVTVAKGQTALVRLPRWPGGRWELELASRAVMRACSPESP